MRLIWFLCRINGNTPHEIFGSYIFNTIMLKLPQTFLFSELCGIIIVWKSIIDSTINYSVLTDTDNYKQYKFLIFFCFLNTLLLIIFETMAFFNPIFMHISNGYALIIIIFLIFGSIKYSFSIRKILTSFISSNDTTVRNIKFVNDLSCFLAIICICTVIMNSMGLFYYPFYKFIGLVIPIHSSELILMFLISYTVSYESRHSYTFRKLNSIAPSTMTSTKHKKITPVVIR